MATNPFGAPAPPAVANPFAAGPLATTKPSANPFGAPANPFGAPPPAPVATTTMTTTTAFGTNPMTQSFVSPAWGTPVQKNDTLKRRSSPEHGPSEGTRELSQFAFDYAKKLLSHLEKESIHAPKWPQDPGNPKKRAAIESLKENYKKYRTRAYASLRKADLIDDPEKRRRLQDALDFKGICEEMCPEFEKVFRIAEFDATSEEKRRPPGAGGAAWPEPSLMVKKFARSAAGQDAPLPMDVRSVDALRRTTDYLIDELLQDESRLPAVHNYLWDRLRAVRKDFTFHSTKTAAEMKSLVYCFENIARFHATALHLLSRKGFASDDFDQKQEIEQLGRTVLSLIEAYDLCHEKDVKCENEPEFRAYYLLLNAFAPSIVQRIPSWGQEYWFDSEEVQIAISLMNAMEDVRARKGPIKPRRAASLESSMFTDFFSIVEQPNVSYTMACMAEVHFTNVRQCVLRSLVKSYSRHRDAPRHITAEILNQFLRFDTPEEAVEFAELHNFEFSTENPRNPSEPEKVPYLVLNNRNRFVPSPRVPQSYSGRIVERKRDSRPLPLVIHNTVFEPATAQVENDEVSDDLFVSQNGSSASLGLGGFQSRTTADISPFGPRPAVASPFGVPSTASPLGGGNLARQPPSLSAPTPGTLLANKQGGTPSVKPVESSFFYKTPSAFANPIKATEPIPKAPSWVSGPLAVTSTASQPGLTAPSSSASPSSALSGSSSLFNKPTSQPAPPSHGLGGVVFPSEKNPGSQGQTGMSTVPAFGILGSSNVGSGIPTSGNSSSDISSPFGALKKQTDATSFQLPRIDSQGLSSNGLTAPPPQPSFSPSTGQDSALTPAMDPSKALPPAATGTAIPTTTAQMDRAASGLSARPTLTATGSVAEQPKERASVTFAPSASTSQEFRPAVSFLPSKEPKSILKRAHESEHPAVAEKSPVQPSQTSLGGLSSQPPAASPFTQPPVKEASAPKKLDLMGDFARWFALGDGGVMEQFTDITVEDLLMKAFADFQLEEEERRRREEDEQSWREARQFQVYNLSVKYFYRWRQIAHERRRKAILEDAKRKQREYRASQSQRLKKEAEDAQSAARNTSLEAEKKALEDAKMLTSIARRSGRARIDTELRRSSASSERSIEDDLLATGIFSGMADERRTARQVVQEAENGTYVPMDFIPPVRHQMSRSVGSSSFYQKGRTKTDVLREKIGLDHSRSFSSSVPFNRSRTNFSASSFSTSRSYKQFANKLDEAPSPKRLTMFKSLHFEMRARGFVPTSNGGWRHEGDSYRVSAGSSHPPSSRSSATPYSKRKRDEDDDLVEAAISSPPQKRITPAAIEHGKEHTLESIEESSRALQEQLEELRALMDETGVPLVDDE